MRFKQNEEGYWMPVDDTVVINQPLNNNSESESMKTSYEKMLEQQPDYNSMTAEQLAELAAEKGIDPIKAKSRTQLIKLLEK